MKRKLTVILIILFLSAAALAGVDAAFAENPAEGLPNPAGTVYGDITYNVPYATWTLGPEYSIVTTQTAYVPLGKYSVPFSPLKAPQDMTYHDGKLYIADTANARVAVLSASDGEITGVAGAGVLKEPAGVACAGGKLYVADKGNKAVYVFSLSDLSLLDSFEKPDNPLVGANTPFVPQKIAVDGRGNMFIVSEGCVNGLMQLNPDGAFAGYVGANETEISLWDTLRNIFYSKEQRDTFLKTPRSPNNVAINNQGLLFTVTSGAVNNSIKKLNTLGSVIMSPPFNIDDTAAVCLDGHGNILSVTAGGTVVVYSALGDLLFAFGEKDVTSERLGVLDTPVAVAVSGDGRLFVLDRKYNMVVQYAPTEYAALVYKAVEYYLDGLYLQGEPLWQEILRLNSNFIFAYSALAQANLKRGEYALALKQFELAEDRAGYSEAYWQIRNEWLQSYLGWALLILIAAAVLFTVYGVLKKRGSRAVKPFATLSKKIGSVKLVNQLLFLGKVAKSPGNSVYEIKTRGRAGVLSATILYLWFVLIRILAVFVTGFLFSGATVYNTNAPELILTSVIPLMLWVVCNYFVSTVTGGEGKFKECYVVTIYSLMPYLVFALPLLIVSNFLTLNEAVIYNFVMIAVYAFSAVTVFLSISELHDFSFFQTIKNILLTLLACALAVLTVIILRMLFGQLFGYIAEVFREVFIL